jgi:hypothetical protein
MNVYPSVEIFFAMQRPSVRATQTREGKQDFSIFQIRKI